MHKIFLAAVAVLVLSGSAFAASEGRQRQQECAAEWKAKKSETGYVAPVKGEGRKAWNAFRSECTIRKGGKSKGSQAVKQSADSGEFLIARKRGGKSRKA